MDVFSICTGWKIWIFFPPSSHNLSLMNDHGKRTKRLFCLYEKLQGGNCAITGPGEGVYIPTGYFHATYAYEYGCTIGTTWSSVQGLAATTDILLTELYPNAEVPVLEYRDVVYFLQSLLQACYSNKFAECKSAMQRICWQELEIADKKGSLLRDWGLLGPKKSTKELWNEIRKSCLSSKQEKDFWACQYGCSSVLEHISMEIGSMRV
jgi:hypothetical protein